MLLISILCYLLKLRQNGRFIWFLSPYITSTKRNSGGMKLTPAWGKKFLLKAWIATFTDWASNVQKKEGIGIWMREEVALCEFHLTTTSLKNSRNTAQSTRLDSVCNISSFFRALSLSLSVLFLNEAWGCGGEDFFFRHSCYYVNDISESRFQPKIDAVVWVYVIFVRIWIRGKERPTLITIGKLGRANSKREIPVIDFHLVS